MIASCKNLIEKRSLFLRATNIVVLFLVIFPLSLLFLFFLFGYVEKGNVEEEEEEGGGKLTIFRDDTVR